MSTVVEAVVQNTATPCGRPLQPDLVSHARREPAAELQVNVEHPRQFGHICLAADLLQVKPASACEGDEE